MKHNKKNFHIQQMVKDCLFFSCAKVNEKFYSFTNYLGIPIMGDLYSEKIDLLDSLKEYDPTFVVDNMLSDEKDIFALELNGKRLMRYNLKEEKCHYFNISCNEKKWGNYAAFGKIDNYFYIFPTYTNGIVKIDLCTGRIQKEKGLYSEIGNSSGLIEENPNYEYFSCGGRVGNEMWLFRRQDSLLVIYDMCSDKWVKYRLPMVINDCIHAIWCDNKMYILSSEGRIYCRNLEGMMEEIADCSGGSLKSNNFSRIVVTDENIIILPFLENNIFIMNLNTKQIKEYDKYPIKFKYCGLKSWSKYYGYIEDNKKYYFATCSSNYMLVVDKQDGEMKWIKFQLPDYEDIMKSYIKYNKKQIYEKECSINEFLYFIKENSESKERKNDCVVRSHAWKHVKKL